MDKSEPHIYKWNRITEPRTYSRSQRVTSNDDVLEWIKKVEDASNRAAAVTFGMPYHKPVGAKAQVKTRVDDLHLHDAAYNEAQELLNEWVTEKLNFDVDEEVPDVDDVYSKKPSEAQVKREWDHLLEDLGEELTPRVTPRHQTPRAASSRLNFEEDEDTLVENILQGMLEKDLVQPDLVTDLGLEEQPRKDPRMKMQLRHQQVKENREKRQKELEKKRKEAQAKKEAQYQARQIILKEEKTKALKAKQEEEQIQREMALIRKEMALEKRRQEEQKARERQEKEELSRRAAEELAQCQTEEEAAAAEQRRLLQEKRQAIQKRVQEIEAREIANNLKILQKHFSAWYKVVMERRLQMGKAKAVCEWRCLVRAWNGWRSYVRKKRLDREAKQHEHNLKESHRKQQLADDHWRCSLLQRCFTAWQLYIQQVEQKKQLALHQVETKSKMAAFLEAAASGRLWSAWSGGADTEESRPDSAHTEDRVDDLFACADKLKTVIPSARSDAESDVSSSPAAQGPKLSRQLPTQPWQITKQHTKLTKKQIAAMGGIEIATPLMIDTKNETDTSSQGDASSAIRIEKPRAKAPFVANTHQHRYAAQQKILSDQQQQIKEQQRLIEELQANQRQQVLQQQLATQQMIREHLEQMKPEQFAASTVQGTTGPASATGSKAGADGLVASQDNTLCESKAIATKANRSDSAVRKGAESPRSEVSAGSCGTSAASRNSRHADFIKSMEERAAERARLKAEREEKKRKTEEERLAKLQAEEDERQRKEEEEKKARIEAYRQKKKLEQQLEQEKQQRQDHMRQLMVKAGQHHERSLLKYRGWRPWRHLLQQSRDNWNKAQRHSEVSLLRKCLVAWHKETEQQMQERRKLADEMHNFIITRKCFHNWKKFKHVMVIQQEKAIRHHQQVLLTRVLHTWLDYATEEKVAFWRKERQAREHDLRRIQKKCFQAWRQYPENKKQELQRQQRLMEMRRKVASILPDFELSSSTKVDESM